MSKNRLASLMAVPLMLVPTGALAQGASVSASSAVYGPVLESSETFAAMPAEPFVIAAVVPFEGDAIPVDAGLGVTAEDAETEPRGIPRPVKRTAAFTLGIGLGIVAAIAIVTVAQD